MAENLPDGWESQITADCFDLIPTTNNKIKTKNASLVGRFPIIDQGQDFISGYTDDEEKVINIHAPVIVFGDHTRVIKWVYFDFVPGADGTKVLKAHDYLSSRYAFYQLKALDIPDKGYSRHFKFLKELRFAIPPLAEQKVIAEKLDSLLAQVESSKARLERIPEIIKRFRQSVLSAAVSGRLTEPPQEATSVFQLKDICTKDRPITYGVIKLGDENHSGVPCLRTSNIRWLNIETSEIKRISKKISNEYSRTILRGNEVLVNVRGTLGGVSTVTASMIGWNVSREVAVVAIDPLKAVDKYVAYMIASNETQQWLKNAQKGVAYVGINLEDLRKLPIRVPSIHEQTEIVRRVEQLFAFADTIEKKANAALERVNKLTQSILAKAFRGELTAEWRAANPDLISGENSAAALLERIKKERETTTAKPNKRKAKA